MGIHLDLKKILAIEHICYYLLFHLWKSVDYGQSISDYVFNENADCPQAKNKSEEFIFKIKFPKFKKGDFSVSLVKDDPSYDGYHI